MFIEKRKLGKSIKYYLVYSYREDDSVKKIRRYLGTGLTAQELNQARSRAEADIRKELLLLRTQVFRFSLSKGQVLQLNNFEKKISIHHFDKKDWQRFTETFVYDTNAIEGSTIQLGEVKGIISGDKSVTNSEEIETKGVAEAVNFIRTIKQDLSLDLIKKLHKLCFQGSKSFAGQFRKVEVVIKDSKGGIVHAGTPVSLLDYELNDLIAWYKKSKNKFRPLVLAAIIHNQFEHIHPFQDGNGRVGRLLLNFILLKNNYPPINIQMADRSEYYHCLQEYSKNNNLLPTLEFFIRQYKGTLAQVTTKNQK
jgi:Fic family protein